MHPVTLALHTSDELRQRVVVVRKLPPDLVEEDFKSQTLDPTEPVTNPETWVSFYYHQGAEDTFSRAHIQLATPELAAVLSAQLTSKNYALALQLRACTVFKPIHGFVAATPKSETTTTLEADPLFKTFVAARAKDPNTELLEVWETFHAKGAAQGKAKPPKLVNPKKEKAKTSRKLSPVPTKPKKKESGPGKPNGSLREATPPKLATPPKSAVKKKASKLKNQQAKSDEKKIANS